MKFGIDSEPSYVSYNSTDIEVQYSTVQSSIVVQYSIQYTVYSVLYCTTYCSFTKFKEIIVIVQYSAGQQVEDRSPIVLYRTVSSKIRAPVTVRRTLPNVTCAVATGWENPVSTSACCCPLMISNEDSFTVSW